MSIEQAYKTANELIKDAENIIIIQAENPDGDSLGSSLALEDMLEEMGKKTSMYCPVDIPKYLRYMEGWDRIVSEIDPKADLAIIVDTQANILLSKVFETPGARHFLESRPVLVIDHHDTESTLDFEHSVVCKTGASTSEVLYQMAKYNNWPVTKSAAEQMLAATLSDTLGLTTQSATSVTFKVASELLELGASPASIEERRREFMKKSAEILEYKGRLLSRIEYFLDGRLALIHIPWEEIREYSDKYNPSVLVLDEMRLVEGVEVAIAVKTYPDGKLTGKIRTNQPVASSIAGFFGGGGHSYASGFRIYEDYEPALDEIIKATGEALGDDQT